MASYGSGRKDRKCVKFCFAAPKIAQNCDRELYRAGPGALDK